MSFIQSIFIFLYSFILALLPAEKYVEGVAGQPRSFLPSQAITQQDKTISHLIYRGLFSYDIYGTLVPDLADTWSISEDGLVYTVKLKANQKWTDGKPITSDDLIYTSFKMPDLSGVATDKVDDLTVRYTLPNKYAPFINLLTVPVMPINSEEKRQTLMPISSGDFRVGRIDKAGSLVKQVVLVTTNDKYKFKKIVFKYYSNDDELDTAAKLGEIDAFLSPNSEHDLPNFDDKKFPLQGIYYSLIFNMRRDPFKKLETRQALEKVLPIDHLIGDNGIGVQGPISRSLFTDQALNFNRYDSAFVGDLANMKITITVPDLPEHKQLATQVKELWEEKLNADVTVRAVDPKDIVSQVIEPRDFDVLLYGQEIGRDPDRYVYWHSTQKDYPGLNLAGFEHVRADRALEAGRDELDNEKRVVHYNEFQKVIYEQVPVIFLYHPYTHFYVSKNIEGIGQKYTFTYSDRFIDFANWRRVQTN